MNPFPVIALINEEATGCINEKAIGAIIAPRNPLSCCFISCFTVSVAPSINRHQSSKNLTILIISSMSLFEMNKVNAFAPLTALHPLIVLSNLSNTD